MKNFLNILAGIASGILGSMGIGGGGILIIYLTLYLEMEQKTAQGLNLLFFIPCAIIALIIHSKNKLVKWKTAIPLIIFGCIGVIAGSIVSSYFSNNILSKIFAVFLFIIGIYTFFSKEKKTCDKK